MSKTQGLVLAGIFGVFSLVIFFSVLISAGNREADLRTRIEASQKANQVVYDRVWKVIQQQANVSEKYADDFRNIYKDIMDARNPQGQATLAKFVTESNPNFDSSLFKQLMSSIEANRRDFEQNQKSLIDIHAEHTKLFRKFPSSIFMNMLSRKEVSIQIVTSTRTERSFETGKDDDVSLFNKGK